VERPDPGARRASRPRAAAAMLGAFLAVSLVTLPASAYVGPGAGIAFLTAAATLLTSAIVSAFLLLAWPVRQLYLLATRKRPPRPPRIQRAIIIGLDGLDPDLAERFMAEGRLPALSKLAAKGTFRKLGTTFPSMSPVAWSSFATGVNPGKHGIYDFLTRDPKTYLPDLASAEIRQPTRHFKLGRYRIPIGPPQLKLLRKSIPFWKILDQYRIPSSILRVPITFPADRFEGTMLSAMCVPDLQGTQGSYTYFFSGPVQEKSIGGREIKVDVKDGRIEAELEGPDNPIVPGEKLKAPFAVRVDAKEKRATLEISGKEYALPLAEYTDWIQVDFKLGLGLGINGICRFRLLEVESQFRLYVTPINIDPSKPVLPISHPRIFSIFLSKLIGRFSTLGLAEDTWALNEGVLDEKAFLDQVEGIHEEREKMFFEMLSRTPHGVLACVFDSTDRVQHMFMRFLDPRDPSVKSEFADVIADTYTRMDQMIARVFEEVDIDDPANLVVVMSDHGFKTFRRGVNLNSWLLQNGYLFLKEGVDVSGEWFEGVDWNRTRAFALGLGGIFLNVKGREANGIVEPGAEAKQLTDELATKLTGLVDEAGGGVAIQKAYASEGVFRGPYRDQAPNLIVGYAAGWRASWDGVRGIVNDVVFDDNDKAWSGDHCIDPKLVPGVLFANQMLAEKAPEPSIEDVAPTLLDLFGIPVPKHMDGRSLAQNA
jgi:predicted AlkP superfamily phosphohydrolase/phosphomutase